MAYQPNSYKKFVATAATATLVASAIVPVAFADNASTSSFTDVGDNYKLAVDYLVSNDIASGLTETTFGVNSTIKRGDAAIMLAKALGIVADDKAPASGFSDVPARATSAINSLKAAGIINGKTATKFGFEDNLTRGEVALLLAHAKAYNLSGDAATLKFTDVGTRYASAVAGMVKAGITTGKTATQFGTSDAIKRGDYAIFIYRAEGSPVPNGEVKSVSAINAKTLEVEFKGKVDSAKASFEVKKGSSVINVATVTFNEEKTKAVLVFSSKLTAGEYTVNVKGLSEETLTKTINVAAETVQNIELLATNAPIKAGKAIVSYKVSNQYGEDITSDVTINSPDTNVVVNKTDKTIAVSNLDLDTTTATPDSRTFTLIHSATGLAKTVTVKATAAAVVSDVQIKGVYNTDGKSLVEGTNLATSSDSYYVEVEAKDQYGNVLKATDLASGLYLTESNSSIVDVTDATNAPTVVEFTTKENVKKTGIKLTGTTAAGTNLITLVSSATGAFANHSIVVAESAKVDVVSMNVPDLVVANEDLLIPVTVTDTKGNNVTDSKKVTNVTAKLGGAAGTFENDKDGKLFLKFAKADVVVGKTTILVVSPTGKAVSQLVDVKVAAVPTLIQGLKANVSTAVYVDKVLSAASFIVKDQYGRTVETLPTGFAVAVKSEGIPSTDLSNVLTFTGLTANAVKKGTEQVIFELTNASTPVANSEKAVSFTVVEKSDFVSYGIEALPTIYANTNSVDTTVDAYDKEVTVYGLTSGGLKVNLRSNDFNVTSNAAELEVENFAGKWVVDGFDTAALADNSSKTVKLTATLNSTGQELNKDVAVSNVAPTVEKVDYINLVSKEAVTTLDFDNTTNPDFSAADVFANVLTTDSYGEEVILTASANVSRITFSNIKDKDITTPITVAANGTGSATLGTLQDGDTFDAVIYVGAQSVKLAVTVK